MSARHLPQIKSSVDEPLEPRNPDSERRRKKKRSGDKEAPEPRPRHGNLSPEIPRDPQDLPEQELQS
jgi:hypothetical protein